MSDLLQSALMECRAEGNTIMPGARRLDPHLYAQLKKLMTDNHGRWKGGNAQRFEFPFPGWELLAAFRRGERPSFKRDFHYFPTPPEVCSQMFNTFIPMYSSELGVKPPAIRILEPSAGQGAILDFFFGEFLPWADDSTHRWDCVEIHPINREKLREKGYRIAGDDFAEFEPEEPYDFVFANPPFKHDAAHIEKMADCLARDGDLCAVVPSSFENRAHRTVAALREKFEWVSFYEIPEKAFKSSGTGVSTKLLAAGSRL